MIDIISRILAILFILYVVLRMTGIFDISLQQEENETARRYRKEYPEEYDWRTWQRRIYGYPPSPKSDKIGSKSVRSGVFGRTPGRSRGGRL